MAYMHPSKIADLYKLFNQGGTAEQIAADSSVHINTLYSYIREWHPQGIIYIADWVSPPHKLGKAVTPRKVAWYQLSQPLGKKDVPYPRKSRKEIVEKGKIKLLTKQLELIASAKYPAAKLKSVIKEFKKELT